MSLTDAAQIRFEAISFFLVLFLGATLVFQTIWNGVRRDVARLPRLSFARVLGLMAMAGFVGWPALSMIAGGRESVVPKAWEAPGMADNLAGPDEDLGISPEGPSPSVDDEPKRRAQLESLQGALWRFAKVHEGRFPESMAASGFADSVCATVDPSGMRYLYVPGGRADEGVRPVAFEPGLYGGERLALFSDGTIRKLAIEAIRKTKSEGGER